MPKIKPSLHLGVNPSNVENYSLVNAKNIKIKDGTIITNDYIKDVPLPTGYPFHTFRDMFDDDNNIFIDAIGCNNELVIFNVKRIRNVHQARYKHFFNIYVYYEEDNYLKLAYTRDILYDEFLSLKTKNIIGNYTHNVKKELIIAFCIEGDVLRTINLGKKESDTIINGWEKSSMIPEVTIPSVSKIEYTQGSSIRGRYNLYVRYKINEYDYTQWYSFGPYFNMSSNHTEVVFKYLNSDEDRNIGRSIGEDNISNDNDYVPKTFTLLLSNLDTNYEYYQLGFSIAKADSKVNYISNDINTDVTNFIFDKNICKKYDDENFNVTFYNYYDVKNIVNYKNKLYISNYKESSNDIDLAYFADKFKFKIVPKNVIQTEAQIKYNIDLSFNNGSNVLEFNELTETKIPIYSKNKDIKSVLYELLHISTDYRNCQIYYVLSGRDGQPNPIVRQPFVNLSNIYLWLDSQNNKMYLGDKDNPYKKTVYNNTTYDILSFVIAKNTLSFAEVTSDTLLLTTYSAVSPSASNRYLSNFTITNGLDYLPTYINNEDKIYSSNTLIPGEVYNFFIHFVDKYGIASEGYRLNYKIENKDENDEYIEYLDEQEEKPIDGNITNPLIFKGADNEEYLVSGDLNVGNISAFYKKDRDNVFKLVSASDITNIFLYNWYSDEIITNYRWCDVLININTIYIEVNGIKYIKTPHVNLYNLNNNILSLNTLGVNIFIDNPSTETFTQEFLNVYSNYFISYEQFDTKNKNVIIEPCADTKHETRKWDENKDFMCYNDEYDIADNINIGQFICAMQPSDVTHVGLKDHISTYYYSPEDRENNRTSAKTETVDSVNKRNYIDTYCDAIDYSKGFKYTIMNNKKLNPANGYDNLGLGTYLSFKSVYKNYLIDNTAILYHGRLLQLNNVNYNKTNNVLIRCSDYYFISNDINNNIFSYFNGCVTYNNNVVFLVPTLFNTDINMYGDFDSEIVFMYNNFFKAYNSGDSREYNAVLKNFIAIIHSITYDTYHHEDKTFNEPPLKISQLLLDGRTTRASYQGYSQVGTLILPQNLATLYKNDLLFDDYDKKKYISYSESFANIFTFDNTIRRSYIINDETLENNWRKFDTEDYINVSYNKGKIVKLVPIGQTFLIHSEHTLFMLDTRNYLQNYNKNIQVDDKDLFDISIKDLFGTEKGFGGIKSYYHSILTQAGYIWWDEDSKHFYRLDEDKFDILDKNIENIIKNCSCFNPVGIVEDKFNNRILISIKTNNEEYNVYNFTLTYNYINSNFESIRDEYFSKSWNTKDRGYYKAKYLVEETIDDEVVDTIKSDIYGLFNDSKYNEDLITYFNNSYIEFIINTEYEFIKFIEFIKYKLKIGTTSYISSQNANNYNDFIENLNNLNEFINGNEDLTYAGKYIRIYNNYINSGDKILMVVGNTPGVREGNINKIDEEDIMTNKFAKAYRDLGNWNISVLRDNSHVGNDIDKYSRLYGNYFIIRFTFDSNKPFEFEFLDIKLTTYRT